MSIDILNDTGEVELLARTVIEIILRIEVLPRIITFSKVLNTLWFSDTLILSGNMIGHKVNDNLHPFCMCTSYKCLKLKHTCIYIDRNIWVDIVIVGNSIRRSGTPLDDTRVLRRYAEG